jgi:hypothetical protein
LFETEPINVLYKEALDENQHHNNNDFFGRVHGQECMVDKNNNGADDFIDDGDWAVYRESNNAAMLVSEPTTCTLANAKKSEFLF